jgi:hypothetical protein
VRGIGEGEELRHARRYRPMRAQVAWLAGRGAGIRAVSR